MTAKKAASVRTYVYAVSFLVFAVIMFGVVIYSVIAHTMKQQMGNQCLGLASAVAALLEVHPKEYRDLINTLDTTTEYYIKTKKLIEKIRFDNLNNIAFLYTEVRVSEDTMMYLFDGEKEGSSTFAYSGLREPLTVTRRRAYDTQSACSGDFVTTIWGTLISAYVPVFDTATGEFIGLVGADVSIEQYDLIMKKLLAVIAGSAAVVALMGFLVIRLSIAKIHADKANISKSNFLSHMSHEIRTPLNAVIGMTAIGKAACGIKKKDHAFDQIGIASRHLLGVINDILDMNKIEANKFELGEEAFDLDKLIQGTLDIVRFRVDEKHQTLTVHVASSIPRRLTGDPQRLTQVITNLLSNAVKFTPEGGSISLEVGFLGDRKGVYSLEFTVSDSGIGISRKQQARLFTPFQQAEGGTYRTYGGTGLGLAISKRIVEMMGGRISVESELGEGAKFSFTVQLKERTFSTPPDTDKEGESVPNTPKDFKEYQVLLVEDVEINREIVMELLSPTGIKVAWAENGAQALKQYQENLGKYDIIFMDLQMPEMDGYEAAQRIRSLEDPRAQVVPIVAMTAHVFREDVERCLEAGMNDHLSKPLDFDAVLNILKKYLRQEKRSVLVSPDAKAQ
ncbi:MAG: response regulator [Treponema sp.]|jgi:signal transduction histidine kinase/ActR/RegA family two-component response regulator|nr:response regulator [Treponema sp.]